MREKLAELKQKRIKVYAEVERFGSKKAFKGYPIETICLTNITDESGKELCEHLWLTVGKQIKNLNLGGGDRITFTARVTAYYKGYKGYREDVYKPIELDYRLSFPTKFVKLTPVESKEAELFPMWDSNPKNI